MKTIFVCVLSFLSANIFAADLFVKEFGGGGAYPNISDAITAASAGDRILVAPKAGNAPYIENLTINKEVQILTATNGGRYKLQGTITINTNLPAGAHVVLDGLWITTGDISAATSTNAINVSIVNSLIEDGIISLGQRINAVIANNTVTTSTNDYSISFRRGKCLGNTINTPLNGISIANDIASSDTMPVVGNYITISAGTTAIRGINWNNNTQFFNISNNYVYSTAASPSSSTSYILINVSGSRSGTNANEYNNIVNNTLRFAVGSGISTSLKFYGISSGSLGNRNNIFNNLILYNTTQPTTNSRYGLSVSGSPQISYNIASGIPSSLLNEGNAPYDATNAGFASIIYTVTADGCVTGNINNGHPDPVFTDLDLTRNDIGACGGSYNITTNFRTSGTAGSAKVHWLEAPRRVLQGGTINIKAEGHDR